MAGKARVHELAKELGVTSKEVLARLSEQGEFVKSASSTVEAPVAAAAGRPSAAVRPPRRLPEGRRAGSPQRHRPLQWQPGRGAGQDSGTRIAEAGRQSGGGIRRWNGRRGGSAVVKPAAPVPGPPAPPCAAHRRADNPCAARPWGGGPAAGRTRPATRSGGAKPGAPRPPRVGNNPFSSAQPVERPRCPGPRARAPAPADLAPVPRVPAAPRLATCRPVPVAASVARAGARCTRPGGGPRPGPGQGGRPGGAGGGGNYRTGGPGGGGPGGGGAAAGGFRVAWVAAVAVPASAVVRPAPSADPVEPLVAVASPSGRNAPSTRTCRRRSSAARLPHGNGETIRLARGASLSDFAEKIDANPAALVQALFNLGEMVTATQSVGDDTLELFGSEMNYVVQVVSPEDEDRELLESFDLTYGEDEGGEEDLEQRPRWSP